MEASCIIYRSVGVDDDIAAKAVRALFPQEDVQVCHELWKSPGEEPKQVGVVCAGSHRLDPIALGFSDLPAKSFGKWRT